MSILIDNFDLFANGLLGTIRLCLLAAVGSLLLGGLIAAFRVSPLPPLRALGTGYVTVFRNMPLTVVMFLSAFGLPPLGVNEASFLNVPGLNFLIPQLGNNAFFRFALIAIVLYTSAFVCEALRAGINAVPTGQAEAARSLGLTFTQNLRNVVLPQAWKFAVVPIGSVIIAMIKNSAIAGSFGVAGDLMYTSDVLVSQEGLPLLPVFLGLSGGYLLLTIPLGLFLDAVERRRAATIR
ncbi:glutamate ABC transporter permease [Rhizocola hellebori]|uniref:Glutamate ABC transporter permease n=1 Tax=Rhizocola hellebori TaxID=1392758 RepID=A0A8J3QH05_9ACTN|nr:amino acid ABC transporter permease [Rhizocola hellebori]GIH10949.1 glutamate ABC transporter permease [Rhizocola hellebori]